ncbi:hypothetical protein JHD50_04435 [Sulfurimonas sp. MAG313]|nr:hypothetical protein [Sulfurimonas sp. MAG313]MDF1880554.1 hypothetical protein [Sulfurimonas sp. MAG313]
MKKILFIALLTFTTLAQSQSFDSFVGVQAGSTNLQINNFSAQRGASYGLRLGFIKDTGRVYLSVENAGLDNADLLSVALNFDAITPRPYRFNDSFALRGFVGAQAGASFITPNTFKNDEGIMGGGQAGILFDFPAQITIELGYKGTWTAAKYANSGIKNYQNFYLAFDYTF